MGIWSSTLFGSGGAIQWQRWQGTLELLVAAPAPFVFCLLPLTVATSSIGSTRPWRRCSWGASFRDATRLRSSAAAAPALPVTVLTLGMLGLVLAATFAHAACDRVLEPARVPGPARNRAARALTLLPAWVGPILSWVLAPTWGMEAIRDAALGGSSAWPGLAVCAALGLAYLALGTLFLRTSSGSPDSRATLPIRARRPASSSWRCDLVPRAVQPISPLMYVTTMLGSPLFRVLFAVPSRLRAVRQDDAFFIVGNAVQVAAMSGIYGMTMGIANERQFGTLLPLATPANRLAVFSAGRCPTSPTGWSSRPRRRPLPDSEPAAGSLASLAFVVLNDDVVRRARDDDRPDRSARDVFFGANLVYFLMPLCGVNVAVDDLPGWLYDLERAAADPRDRGGASEVAAARALADVSG